MKLMGHHFGKILESALYSSDDFSLDVLFMLKCLLLSELHVNVEYYLVGLKQHKWWLNMHKRLRVNCLLVNKNGNKMWRRSLDQKILN